MQLVPKIIGSFRHFSPMHVTLEESGAHHIIFSTFQFFPKSDSITTVHFVCGRLANNHVDLKLSV